MCWAPAQGQQLVQLWQVKARQAHPSRAFAVGYAAVEQAQGDRADILRAASHTQPQAASEDKVDFSIPACIWRGVA